MAIGVLEVVLVLFAMILWYFLRRRRPEGYPPGPLSLPVIGNLHQLGTRPFVKFIEMQKKYGDIFAIDFGSFRGVILNSHNAISEALSMPEFSGRPKLRPLLEKGGGRLTGVILGVGQPWVEHRRFILRHIRDFGFGKQSMESLILDEVRELLRTIANLQGKLSRTENLFNLAVLNSLWWITVGERFEHTDKKLHEIVSMFTESLADSPAAGVFFFFPCLTKLAPKLSGYNSYMRCQFAATDLVKQKIEREKASFKPGVLRHFLDVYIDAVLNEKDTNSSFYGEEGEYQMIHSITDLFIAGIETMSTTLSWAFMLVTVHSEVQEKLFTEIESVIGTSRLPTLDDERSLPYAKAVVNEVLRFSSILPFGMFHSTTTDVRFHGYQIPKDTMIITNLYAANRDPEIWTEPDVFMPERFLESDGRNKKSDKTLAFSTGKRVCIAESLARNELFLFITSIVQRFKVAPNPEKPRPAVDYIAAIALLPKPYEYVFKDRVNNSI